MEERLRGHIQTLAGEIGERNIYYPEAYRRAANYIKKEWSDQGYEPVSFGYKANGVDCENLEVTKRGEVAPDEIILVGAHYDTVQGSYGANDNGSGVAAMLEISREIAKTGTGRTVRFVAFANEEPPFFRTGLMGSRVYAKMAKNRNDNIVGVIVLETIGYFSDAPGSQLYPPLVGYFYPDKANFIAFVSNLSSLGWMGRVTNVFEQKSSFPYERISLPPFLAPGIDFSDHASFWKYGYPAIMVTDTAFYRYAHYHTKQDTPDKVNYGALAILTEDVTNTVAELAMRAKKASNSLF